jgi:hypothetical protein
MDSRGPGDDERGGEAKPAVLLDLNGKRRLTMSSASSAIGIVGHHFGQCESRSGGVPSSLRSSGHDCGFRNREAIEDASYRGCEVCLVGMTTYGAIGSCESYGLGARSETLT